MKVFFAGDIVGRPGRTAIENLYPAIKVKYDIDVFIANAENAAGGSGITPDIARQLHSAGIDVLTSGDHIWKEKAILDYIGGDSYLLKPANMPKETPGALSAVFTAKNGDKVGVICLLGRTFMSPVDCPFKTAEYLVERIRSETPVIIIDFHAEATSEKQALGRFLDGRVSAVIGTHTHVQTADETILPNGTAYITDTGMTGPFESIIGREIQPVLHRFITQMPAFFKVATNDIRITGVVITIDPKTGKAESIQRIQHKL
jgi:metallophosphoesterase (TIGR00282 family)